MKFPPIMNALFQKLPFRLLVFLLICSSIVRLKAEDTERFYSMSEVSVIDRENKLWRLVDATEEVDANIHRLLVAGLPALEVEKFKARLIALWGDIDPSLQIDWLDQKTVTRIEALKSGYTVSMRRARIDHELDRLGVENTPATPDQIIGRWRGEIWSLLDLDQREDFTLMNTARAVALCHLARDLPTTTQERLALCRLQQEYSKDRFRVNADKPSQITINEKEALLHYWQNMRDLLGDERFATYLRTSDAGFGRMSFVLDQVAGMNSKMVLDLWWVRKKDELEDLRTPSWRISRHEMKMEVYDSAVTILGSRGMTIYLGDDDSKWLEGKPTSPPVWFRMAMERPAFPRKPE